jgi:hypothetical protein
MTLLDTYLARTPARARSSRGRRRRPGGSTRTTIFNVPYPYMARGEVSGRGTSTAAIETSSGTTSLILGHAHPDVAAVEAPFGSAPRSLRHRSRIELAGDSTALPSLEQIRFTNSGTGRASSPP